MKTHDPSPIQDVVLKPLEEPIFRETFTKLLARDELFIIEFYSEDCVTCPAQFQILETLNSHPLIKQIYTLDVGYEQNYALAKNLTVKKLPTVFVFRNKSVHRFDGLVSKDDLSLFLDREKCCLNCKRYTANKTRFGHGYCKKYRIYPSMKDVCVSFQ